MEDGREIFDEELADDIVEKGKKGKRDLRDFMQLLNQLFTGGGR